MASHQKQNPGRKRLLIHWPFQQTFNRVTADLETFSQICGLRDNGRSADRLTSVLGYESLFRLLPEAVYHSASEVLLIPVLLPLSAL